MAKVTITGLATRKAAQDYKKVSPLHKPGTKAIPAQSMMKNATPSQDKVLNLKQI